MRILKIIVLTLLTLTLGTITLFGMQTGPAARKSPKGVRTYANEYGVRRMAIATVMPAYPEEAINDGAQGEVDAAVRFDEDGTLDRVKILESPHPALSKAVTEAVKQWKVKLLFSAAHERKRLHGELRFHFVIKDGQALVENPSIEEQNTQSRAFTKLVREDTGSPGTNNFGDKRTGFLEAQRAVVLLDASAAMPATHGGLQAWLTRPRVCDSFKSPTLFLLIFCSFVI
jgi:TonB family protein